MVQGLGTVIYHVADLDRAKTWYAAAFGQQPYFDQPFYVGFNIAGYELGLDPNPKAGDTFTERRGVRIYRNTDGKGEKWDRHILEDGGVAVEDLAVGDLNGDGKADIVAVGRQTGNCRIYWNQGK